MKTFKIILLIACFIFTVGWGIPLTISLFQSKIHVGEIWKYKYKSIDPWQRGNPFKDCNKSLYKFKEVRRVLEIKKGWVKYEGAATQRFIEEGFGVSTHCERIGIFITNSKRIK